jgi:acetolactate synthase-1/2/3 large subunit
LLSELVARLPARVISSPRGKGVFPETHPAYLGVSGHGGHERLSSFLKSNPVDTLLILGTRLHELTSYWDSSFSPCKRIVHVDCRAGALGDGFLDVPTLGIQAEIGEFLQDLLVHVNGTPQSLPAQESGSFVEYRPEGEGPGIHPADLMEMVQLEVVEGRDIPVMAEAGFAWSWAAHCLRFDSPRFRVSTTWGSMGHFSAGVLGAALATQKPAVSLVGDGAMLMQNEVSTAVAYDAPAKWLVLNNRGYGTIHHGLAASGLSPMELDIPRVHFADWATAQGATGLAVATKDDLRLALRDAIASPGPVVIDAHVDSSVRPPFGRRIECLVSNYGTWRT